jgi:YD repeat-containing protein
MYVLACVVLAVTPALAQQTRYYSPNGTSLGTSSPTSPNSQRYYDARGNSLGTSTTTGRTTTHYDARGNVTSRSGR